MINRGEEVRCIPKERERERERERQREGGERKKEKGKGEKEIEIHENHSHKLVKKRPKLVQKRETRNNGKNRI